MLSSKQFCGISNGSACTSHEYSPSYVLTAMGLDADRISSAIRISWGAHTDKDELINEVKKSKVGILLCDEFEKTTRPVYSFFLELLEEGHFTDSMAREYDMDGYVIIFTSNLLSEAEYKKEIPPELQTRFDLVCEFEKPEMSEKIAFLELLLEKARNKYSEQFARIEMTEQEKTQLFDFDYASLSALRDIKRIFNNRLMDYFIEKGVM